MFISQILEGCFSSYPQAPVYQTVDFEVPKKIYTVIFDYLGEQGSLIGKSAQKDKYELVRAFQVIADEQKSQKISSIILDYLALQCNKAEEIPECAICYNALQFPVQLGCGHIFDLDCISTWFSSQQKCPLDRIDIDVSEITYVPDIIQTVGVIFNFCFLSSTKINPMVVSIDSSMQRLKSIIATTAVSETANPITALFSPIVHQENPRKYLLRLNGQRLHSNTFLTQYSLEPGKTYTVAVMRKFAEYGLPCDHCFKDREKEQTCNHPDA